MSATTADAAPPLDGGRYRLVRVLGVGGMATVYEAHDARLDVRRAIKVLDPGMFARARIRERFDAEARTMARLVHPHICTVHDVGLDERRAYIVMEYVEGGTLQDRIQRGGIDARQAALWMLDVLEALAAAHAAGVIHRDLKPHNVLLTRDGKIKLGDFGIAQLTDPERSAPTKTGAVLGTPAFMPPEQKVDSRSVGPSADVYAAGATLFALLTGREPHDLFAHEAKQVLLPLIPPALAPIVDRATRYLPADRYPSAQAMRDALAEALPRLDGLVVAEPVQPTDEASTFAMDDELPPPAPRRRTRLWLGAAAACLAVIGIAALTRPRPGPAPVRPVPAAGPAMVTPAPSPVVPEPVAAPVAPVRQAKAPRPVAAPVPEPVVAPVPDPVPLPDPEPPPPAPAVETVACRIASTTPASVSIDGVVVGRTPFTGAAPVGRHQVSIAPDGGGPVFVRTFSFDAGGRVSYCHDFEAGRPCK